MAANYLSGLFQPVVMNAAGTGIIPAAGYKAKFYEAGTDIPKTVYTDPDLLVPYPSPSNIAFLDATGKAAIYLAVGGYKLVLTDTNDVPVPGYTIDNIVGQGAFGTGFVNSFAELEAVNTSIFPYTYIGGYYTQGDGGHGMFYNTDSTDPADGGYVQESTFDPTKRWFRIPDEDGKVRSASFGAIGLSNNRTDNMASADTYAAALGATLLINVATRVNTMTFTALSVEFAEGAFIRGFAAATVTFNGVVSGPYSILFSHSLGGGLDVVLSDPSQQSNPYWFEGSPSQSAGNNATAFAKWKAAGAGVFVVPAGTWAHTGTFTPASGKLTLFYGSVGSRIPGTYYGPASLIDGNLSLDVTGTFALDGNMAVDGAFSAITITGTSVSATGGIDADSIIASNTIQSVSGPITSGGSVSAVTTMTAGGNVRSGNTGEGHLIARPGTATATFRAGGPGQVVVGTGSLSLPANSVTGLYGYLRITGSGTIDASMTRLQVSVGANNVFDWTGSTASASFYRFEVEVFRTGATTSYSTGYVIFDEPASATDIQAAADVRAVSVTWANSNTIQQVATGGVVGMTKFEYGPYDGT